MPKDYKHINQTFKKTRTSSNKFSVQGFMNFITGLVIGLFVAFIIYLKEHDAENKINVATPEINIKQLQDMAHAKPEDNKNIPEPEFDFYQILPNMEVNISEWAAEEDSSPPAPAVEESGVYVLQVGSFKDFEAADELKAKLALMGISADIQRVVLNGRDVIHRVRIGPYKELQKLNEVREMLIANNLEFMLLKLKVDDN